MKKIYLRTFLVSGSIFGVIMGLQATVIVSLSSALTMGWLSAIVTGLFYGIATGLISGLFFGFSMSLILGTLQLLFTSNSTLTSDARGVHQQKILELQLPYEKTIDLCIASLSSVMAKVKQEERSSGRVVAKTEMTWKSFGETIQFDVRKIDSEKTQVKVSSKPSLSTTLVDYGKNLQNVEKISEVLLSNNQTFTFKA